MTIERRSRKTRKGLILITRITADDGIVSLRATLGSGKVLHWFVGYPKRQDG